MYGLPWWLSWQRICLQCKRRGFDPWVGRIPWRRSWLPTPVFLPGKSHGQRGPVGDSPWGHKESDTTERLTLWLFISGSWIFVDLLFQTAWLPDGGGLPIHHECGLLVRSKPSLGWATEKPGLKWGHRTAVSTHIILQTQALHLPFRNPSARG